VNRITRTPISALNIYARPFSDQNRTFTPRQFRAESSAVLRDNASLLLTSIPMAIQLIAQIIAGEYF
jgi:hypothetical protein